MFKVYYYFNNKEKAYEFANKLHRGNTYAVVDTLANLDFKNYIYSEKDHYNFVDRYVVICTYDTIRTEHGIVRELQYTNVEEAKKMEDTIKEDKDIDQFDDIYEEGEETKKEDPKKSDLKKIALYFGLLTLGFIIGRGRKRYIPVTSKDNIHFTIPRSNEWTYDQKRATLETIEALNRLTINNRLVICKDRRKKNATMGEIYET